MQETMFKTTTKQRIKAYLKNMSFCWVSGSELERQADDWETKASVISRRCRELARDGEIQRRVSQRGTVEYHT